jgi:hypothetical protein
MESLSLPPSEVSNIYMFLTDKLAVGDENNF